MNDVSVCKSTISEKTYLNGCYRMTTLRWKQNFTRYDEGILRMKNSKIIKLMKNNSKIPKKNTSACSCFTLTPSFPIARHYSACDL